MALSTCAWVMSIISSASWISAMRTRMVIAIRAPGPHRPSSKSRSRSLRRNRALVSFKAFLTLAREYPQSACFATVRSVGLESDVFGAPGENREPSSGQEKAPARRASVERELEPFSPAVARPVRLGGDPGRPADLAMAIGAGLRGEGEASPERRAGHGGHPASGQASLLRQPTYPDAAHRPPGGAGRSLRECDDCRSPDPSRPFVDSYRDVPHVSRRARQRRLLSRCRADDARRDSASERIRDGSLRGGIRPRFSLGVGSAVRSLLR